jgi:simple sugar transport system ATP-binding protein
MRVELRSIHKHFGPVPANVGISLTIPAGTIHGLLGENGAGKSTLMKVLSGYFAADRGEIVLAGVAARLTSPADALRHGVGMLHQDPLDFPPLLLLDNFLLGQSGFRQNRRAARQAFVDVCRQFGFDLDPEAFVGDLTVGERQQLEIARLLWMGARALILDEPTTGISAPQKVKLFATLKQLAAQGKTIIFVSHKLEDVEALCDHITVLRQGQVAGEAAPPYATEQLVQLMFGQTLTVRARPSVPLGAPALAFAQVALTDGRLQVDDLNLTIAAGEVIGLAGLEGSGQQLLLQACAGLLPPTKGRVRLGGVDLTRQPYQRFLQAGVAYAPANRLREGLVPGLTLAEHVVLARRGPQPALIDWNAAQTQTQTRITDFNIKGAPASRVESLSGGNQQRALLALLPETGLRVLAVEHPTRGLDVESAMYIWGKLLERRKQGLAIVFATADLDELLQYSDRILVFFSGRVLAEVNARETTTEQLGYLIGGKAATEAV